VQQTTTTTSSSTTTDTTNTETHHQLHPLPRQNLFAEPTREKPTTTITSKRGSLQGTGAARAERTKTNWPDDWVICSAGGVVVIVAVAVGLTIALRSLLSACVRWARDVAQSTQARAAIKAAVTGDDSNILNANVVKYTTSSSNEYTFLTSQKQK